MTDKPIEIKIDGVGIPMENWADNSFLSMICVSEEDREEITVERWEFIECVEKALECIISMPTSKRPLDIKIEKLAKIAWAMLSERRKLSHAEIEAILEIKGT